MSYSSRPTVSVAPAASHRSDLSVATRSVQQRPVASISPAREAMPRDLLRIAAQVGVIVLSAP